MARVARTTFPETLLHVICRLVDGRFLIDSAARNRYLSRLGRALSHSDWRLLAYALMSNHIHLAMIAGRDTLHSWIHPLHTSMALWMNARARVRNPKTLGHVFAQRPTTLLVKPQNAGNLIAYLHNNPERAGIVSSPAETSWTSHRIYLGRELCPPWLHVELGLKLAGFCTGRADRKEFHRFVCARSAEPGDARSAGEMAATGDFRQFSTGPDDGGAAGRHADVGVDAVRGRASKDAPYVAPMRIAHLDAGTALSQGEARTERASRDEAVVRDVLHRTCALLQVSEQAVLSRTRARRIVRARRVALMAWERVSTSRSPMCAVLCLTPSAAAQLLDNRACGCLCELADEIASSLK